MRSPTGSAGSSRARAPVARTMCRADSVAPLSSDSLPDPASLALAANTDTPFFFIRCATPWPRRPATLRDRATMAARSGRASPAPVTPYCAASWQARSTVALCSSALVGMQPQFRQMPPSSARSTSATDMPNCAARMAAT
ncbi:hypothetical protein D3C72_1138640 [compost metagenome]